MSFVIFDVVILILLLLTAWKGYRRGFVLTLCSLLAVFVAFIGATVISSQLARPMSPPDPARSGTEHHSGAGGTDPCGAPPA